MVVLQQFNTVGNQGCGFYSGLISTNQALSVYSLERKIHTYKALARDPQQAVNLIGDTENLIVNLCKSF